MIDKIHNMGGASRLGIDVGQQFANLERNIASMSPRIASHFDAMFHPLKTASNLIGKVESAFFRLGATIWGMERVGAAMKAALVDPMQYVMDSTAKQRVFEASIAGQLGPTGAASADSAIIRNLNNVPFSLDQSRQQFTAMTHIAPFARQIANGDMTGTLSQFSQYQNVLAGLQTLNPSVTAEQLSNGVQGAMLGGAA